MSDVDDGSDDDGVDVEGRRPCRALRPGHSLEAMPFPYLFWDGHHEVGSLTAGDGCVGFTTPGAERVDLYNHAVDEIVEALGEVGGDGWLRGSGLLWAPDPGYGHARQVWWVLTEPVGSCEPPPTNPVRRQNLTALRAFHRFLDDRYAGTSMAAPWFRPVDEERNDTDAPLPDWVVAWTVNCGRVAPGARDRGLMGGRFRFEPKPTDLCSIWTAGSRPDGLNFVNDGLHGSPAIWAWGLVTRGIVVVPPSGDDTDEALAELEAAADAAVDAGDLAWWVPALVGDPGGSRVGILFDAPGPALDAAARVGCNRLITVGGGYWDIASQGTVSVRDRAGNELAAGDLPGGRGHLDQRRFAPLATTDPTGHGPDESTGYIHVDSTPSPGDGGDSVAWSYAATSFVSRRFKLGVPLHDRPLGRAQRFTITLEYDRAPRPWHEHTWAAGLAAKLADVSRRGPHTVTIEGTECGARWTLRPGSRLWTGTFEAPGRDPVITADLRPPYEHACLDLFNNLVAAGCGWEEPLQVEVRSLGGTWDGLP